MSVTATNLAHQTASVAQMIAANKDRMAREIAAKMDRELFEFFADPVARANTDLAIAAMDAAAAAESQDR